MELRDLDRLYNFNRPLKVLIYSKKPFKVTAEAYVIDGKLVDDDGEIVCDDINTLDFQHGYNLFLLECDEDYLVAKVCRMTND